MDGQRFDEITRAFATGTSRRRLLSSVAAGLAGALAGAIGLSETDAARGCKGSGGTCGSDRDCCQEDPSRCAAGKCCPTPRYCPGSGVCCDPGLKCCDDTCVSFDIDPANCGGCEVVCASGVCAQGSCLKLQGEACTTGSECGSGFCADGVCCDADCTGQCEACGLAGNLGACTPVVGAPVGQRLACLSDGSVCGGTCDGSTRETCTYPDITTLCGDSPSCNGATLTVERTCDSSGGCLAAETIDCSPYVCGETSCLTSCDGSEDCTSGVCIDGSCCAGEDACVDFCCSPDRSETAACCPGTGRCCECFDSTDPGNEGLFCCDDSTKICGTYPNDTCCHHDEGCFNDACIWEERLCEGGVCPNKCCGGECCGPWDTCGFDQNGNEVCQPLPNCTVDNEATVCEGGLCVSVDIGVSVCCPGERVIDLSEFGAPEGTYTCCPFGQQPSQGGDPSTCCPGPNFCGTSRGGAVRL